MFKNFRKIRQALLALWEKRPCLKTLEHPKIRENLENHNYFDIQEHLSEADKLPNFFCEVEEYKKIAKNLGYER